MKILFISKETDHELIRKMVQQVKSSEDFLLLLTAAFHYRKIDSCVAVTIKELSNMEISYNTWLELLNHKDPWYFRISNA